MDEPVIQASTDKTDEVLIKVPLLENGADQTVQTVENTQNQANANVSANSNSAADMNANTQTSATTVADQVNKQQVNQGREKVKQALNTFGKEAEPTLALDQTQCPYKISVRILSVRLPARS